MYLKRPLCAFCLLFVLILAVIMSVWGVKEPCGDTGLDGKQLNFTGTINRLERKNDNLIIHINDISFSNGTVLSGKVMMYLPDHENTSKQVHIGASIRACGEFSDFDGAYNRGQFDLRRYRALTGYCYAVYNGRIEWISGKYNRIADGLYRVRERTVRVYDHYFSGDDSGLIKALVLADKSGLDPSVKERYSDAGIAHILAMSGLHIATLGLMFIKFLRRIRLDIRLSVVTASCLMLAYCIMTGMPVSALRALIMFFLSVTAMVIGRSPDIRTSAAIACLIMLIINPDRLYDASFLLSFSSVLGIGLVYPYMRELVHNLFGRSVIRQLKRSENPCVRLGMALASSMLLSLSVQLAILPFTMWFYYRIPVYGLLINLAVVPLAGALLIFAVLTGLLGSVVLYVTGTGNLLDMLVCLISYPARLILKFYDLMTGVADSLPGAVFVTGRPGMWQMVSYCLILTAVLACSAVLKKRTKIITGQIRRMSNRNDITVKLKRYLIIRSACLMAMIMFALILLFVKIRPAFELSSLYVGQGQCLIVHGRDVPTIMYDCGSSDEKDMAEYIVGPFLDYCGISRVDTAFVSHMDTDHVGGLIGLLNDENSHLKIGRIVVSDDPGQKKSENHMKLMEAAGLRNVPVYTMGAEDSMTWKKLSVRGFAPLNDIGPYEDANDGSLVLELRYRKSKDSKTDDFSALFTGDISGEVETALMEDRKKKGGIGRGYDYLQVAHHGSRFSANEDFISFVSPRAAVISAGINNRYGHPHEETLKMFEKLDIPVYVTSKVGEIIFSY